MGLISGIEVVVILIVLSLLFILGWRLQRKRINSAFLLFLIGGLPLLLLLFIGRLLLALLAFTILLVLTVIVLGLILALRFRKP